MAAALKALVLFLKSLLGLLKIEFGTLVLPTFSLAPRPLFSSIQSHQQQPGIFAWEASQLLPP